MIILCFKIQKHRQMIDFKEKLLLNGDRWESELAANLQAEYLYR